MIARKKSRYILIELSRPLEITSAPAYDEFIESIKRNIGMLDFSSMGIYPIKRLSDSIFIFKVNRGYEKKFILASAFISSLSGYSISIYSICTSGTIKALLKKYERKYVALKQAH
ncbi:MAG: Rpp14/Pop5 family protein [Candidatus Micrarchaeia archaeon]